jgi:hypothetical protein
MKYIITGQGTKDGNNAEDSSTIKEYYELGWELVCTRLAALQMLVDKKISAADCIVTRRDRMCLYSKIFHNVVAFEDFDPGGKNIINLCERFSYAKYEDIVRLLPFNFNQVKNLPLLLISQTFNHSILPVNSIAS